MSTAEQAGAKKDLQHEKRIRTLTDKGMEEFNIKVKSYNEKIQQTWSTVQIELDNLFALDNDKTILRQAEQSIRHKYEEYQIVCKEYVGFLEATRSNESNRLVQEHLKKETVNYNRIQSVLGNLEARCLKIPENDSRSIHSKSSRSSFRSTSSVSVKAKLEAAKARRTVTQKEFELKTKQALLQEELSVNIAKAERRDKIIEAELCLLKDEKLVAEATAENNVYETLSEWHDSEKARISVGNIPHTIEPPMQRTKDYVMKHSVSSVLELYENTNQHNEPEPYVNAPYYHRPSTSRELDLGTEFGKFLVKKDLLMTRFTKFQDNPVVYSVWKNTFICITKELNVTPQEEIDLLIKWLGTESSKQALNLRAANAHDPEGGLQKIWQRLDERYGAPELVESTLQKKIASFPRITVKDYKKLYDLSDVLSEIESVKENTQYSTLLSYYDSPIGVNPIVSKLPTHLQNKWADRARKYKVSQGVTFPPFAFFVSFIREMCALLNDPSFQFDTSFTRSMNKEEVSPRSIRYTPIASKKSGIQSEEKPKCFFHSYTSSHSLDLCREFKKMSIEEKRQFLKEKNICFRCCKSDKHMIKDCKVPIKCDECGSQKHTSVLQIFKPVKPYAEQNNSVPEKEASDGNSQTLSNISCKCSQVCDDASLSKSCAKIVKVHVYHKDRPEDRVSVYALIDDQSNRSLASPEFFDFFKGECSFQEITYSLSSCGGSITTSGRTGEGFVIESLDGSTHELPCLTECNEIPDNREEIPTPDVANKYVHLRNISTYIPSLDKDSHIQLLIGRDIPEVHHVHEQIIGPTGPYAQKLSLGWVLIGETYIGNVHTPNMSVKVNKTFVHKSGRQSIFPECESKFNLKEGSDQSGNI